MPELNSRNTLDGLLKKKALYNLQGVAGITGYCVRWLRILCHGKKVNHQRILGRYYMTAEDVAGLIEPVKKQRTP